MEIRTFLSGVTAKQFEEVRRLMDQGVSLEEAIPKGTEADIVDMAGNVISIIKPKKAEDPR